MSDLALCSFQVGSELSDCGPNLAPFSLDGVSLSGRSLGGSLGLGQLVGQVRRLLFSGIEVSGQLGDGGLKRVSLGGELLYTLAGGVVVGRQLLDRGLGSDVLVAGAFKICLEAASLSGKLLGGGVILGELIGQPSDLLSSGIKVSGRLIPFCRNAGQLAVELLGRLGGCSNQMVVVDPAASKLVIEALELSTGCGQVSAQVYVLVLDCR